MAGAPLLAGVSSAATRSAATGTVGMPDGGGRLGPLPVAEIEAITRAQGAGSNGVLNIEIDRRSGHNPFT